MRLTFRRRPLRVAALVVAAIVIVGSGALAQDYIFTNFSAHVDHPVNGTPCALKGAASPVVYDTSLWILYTCVDDRVIARRYIHPHDGADRTSPRPVFVVPNPYTPPTPPTPPPAGSCPGNMVAGRLGGCVPADHPMAVR